MLKRGYRRWTFEEFEFLKNNCNTYSPKEIAQKLNRTKSSVNAKLHFSGLTQQRQGENHHNWKGGRIFNRGGGNYIAIHQPYHPFCNSLGYVLEHRLIMENKLGRFLTKNEIVHHINGKQDDNRYENLELTTKSKHSINHQTTHGRCKNRKEYMNWWSKQNREKIREWTKNHRIKNKEIFLLKEKEYREKNREKLKKYQREYMRKYRLKKNAHRNSEML